VIWKRRVGRGRLEVGEGLADPTWGPKTHQDEENCAMDKLPWRKRLRKVSKTTSHQRHAELARHYNASKRSYMRASVSVQIQLAVLYRSSVRSTAELFGELRIVDRKKLTGWKARSSQWRGSGEPKGTKV